MRKRNAIIGMMAAAVIVGGAGLANSGQEEHIKPDYLKINKQRDAKHTAKVVAPDSVTAGEWFDVEVSLGIDATHPSFAEHSVQWVALYAGEVEISRIYFHPVMSKPQTRFTIALVKSTTLRVLAMPNHAGPFETKHKIKVTPAE